MIRVFDQGENRLLVFDDETKLILAKNATKNQAVAKIADFLGGDIDTYKFVVDHPEPFIELAGVIDNKQYVSLGLMLKVQSNCECLQEELSKVVKDLDEMTDKHRDRIEETIRLANEIKELKAEIVDLQRENEKLRNTPQTAQKSPQTQEKQQTDKLSPESEEGLKSKNNASKELEEQLSFLLWELNKITFFMAEDKKRESEIFYNYSQKFGKYIKETERKLLI